MKKEKFDNKKFKKDFGIPSPTLQPYNYQRYKRVNPNLTEDAYRHLRGNGSEWKILCGLSVSTHWGNEILKETWYLKCGNLYKDSEFFKFRYVPEKYLDLEW